MNHSHARGGQLALVDGVKALSYAELEGRSARCAAMLAAAGVARGDRVALLLGNRSAYVEALFAAARLGAMAVPVNTRWSPREIAVLLADCTPAAILHEAEMTEPVARACEQARHAPALRLVVGGEDDPYEQALAAHASGPEVAPVTPDDPMILMYTSGTTGVPKGALLPHRKTLYNSRNAEIFFRLTPDDRVLVVLPLFHSFGLAILTIPTLHVGGTLYLQDRFDPDTVWRTVEAERISFFGAVPTMFRRLHDQLEKEDDDRYDLSSLRFLFSAGAAIPTELIRAYESRGMVLKQGFGQTETSILTCLDARDAIRKAGSVGRPVVHAELRVVDPAGIEGPVADWRDVAVGEPGEIVVRGPITMLGYWKRPEESAETLREGWLRTHDLATVDDEGFLTLVGRSRDMFISGGENVYPAEVEAVLEEHPALREVAVVGEPDETWGEAGRAYVVLQPGAALEPEALQAWARDRLASFKIPRSFVALEALPRTETGKVQKFRLGDVAPAGDGRS